MKFILGKKLDMTQVWKGEEAVAVTRVQAGPCVIVQVKDEEKDGYKAVQIGYGEKKEKNIKKPQLGHMKKAGVNSKYLKEFRLEQIATNQNTNSHESELKVGDVIDVSTFAAGDIVKVTGTSKGKGFQGGVKRHGFHGQDKGHGNKDQLRMPGSIGAGEPQRVFKGTRMAGRMGGDRVSLSNLEIIEVDKENNILLVKGAVPGARNGLVMISGDGELKLSEPLINTESTEDTETEKTENSEQTTENKEEVKEEEKSENKQEDKVEEVKKEDQSKSV